MPEQRRRPFVNHFGPRATAYAAARPRYPRALFHYLATIANDNRSAWDVGTGNGQAAVGLVERWARVLATDPSEEMIARAIEHPRVKYQVATYDSGLADQSASLVSVAQALHWFDITAFMKEVRRVLTPDGIFAAWCYSLCRLDDPLDGIVDRFYHVTLGGHWPTERRLVDDGYRTIPLPLDEMSAPQFQMVEDWRYEDFIAYVRTWSGLNRLIEARGDAEVVAFEEELRAAWGPPLRRRQIRWPVHARIGTIR